MDRRKFLSTAAATGPFLGRVLGANDRIVIGQIGLGSRGYYEVTINLKNPGVDIAAVCDVYRPLADLTKEKCGSRTEAYSDFRRVLDRKDIDAVFVSTPDHWHAPITLLACEAGKDVYCEKPVSHTVAEGRWMVEAARKHNRVVGVGSQQRSAPHFAKCAELVQSGYIGDVSAIDCWIVSNEYPQGEGMLADSAPPAGLDWDLYLGPASKVAYNRNRYIWNFRWYWDYSGGNMTDWGAHHLDSIHQIMNVKAPKSAYAVGTRKLKDDRDTPDTLLATIEYPTFTVRFTNSQVGVRMDKYAGTFIYGTKGALFVDRGGYEVYDLKGNKTSEVKAGKEASSDDLVGRDSMTDAHFANFIAGIRKGEKLNAPIWVGNVAVTMLQLSNIAWEVNRKLELDTKDGKIRNDAEAMKGWQREYEHGWAPKL